MSIVVFRPDLALLRQTLHSLAQAVAVAGAERPLSVTLWLIDNTPSGETMISEAALRRLLTRQAPCAAVRLRQGHGNIGYGAGHNLAAVEPCDWRLVLNADVELADDALLLALRFLRTHPQAGLLAPAVVDGQGRAEHLCKRYPSVFDLLLRGFAPAAVRRCFRHRLACYEMRDLDRRRDPVWDVPIVSGCFMLMRQAALQSVGGFSPRYFLYFEDFDLSLRMAGTSRLVYLPAARITHYGGGAARKGWRHVAYFVRSGIAFFNRHGWKWA